MVFYNMAAGSDEHAKLENVNILRSPVGFLEDWSTLCMQIVDNDKVIVGSENGVFITSLDSSSCCIGALKKYNSKEVPSICAEADNNNFYIASETSIQKFDFRCPLDKAICCYDDNSDEINQIAINDDGLLVATDDSGECKIYDTKKSTLYRTLRNRHKNICSSVTFLSTRKNDIVTGGLDSQILLWNYTTAKVNKLINTQDLLQQQGDNSVNMFNPPMVNSLAASSDGKLLASGLGNGSIQTFHVFKSKVGISPSLLINQHSSLGVTSVNFIDTGCQDVYLLASGGNDAEVNIWKQPPIEVKNKKQTIPTNKVIMEKEELASHNMKQFKLKSKINTLFSYRYKDKIILLVGDQTSKVKYYDITSFCL